MIWIMLSLYDTEPYDAKQVKYNDLDHYEEQSSGIPVLSEGFSN